LDDWRKSQAVRLLCDVDLKGALTVDRGTLDAIIKIN
jgi:hypothetical protein